MPTRQSAETMVSLREVDKDTVWAVCRLAPSKEQARFVAPNTISIVEAYFDDTAEFRAIYADEIPVGFLMWCPSREEHGHSFEKGAFHLWRFMIDAQYQRRGYGRAALFLLVDVLRQKGAKQLWSSYGPGDGCPRGFYLSFGFEDTGQVSDGEQIILLNL